MASPKRVPPAPRRKGGAYKSTSPDARFDRTVTRFKVAARSGTVTVGELDGQLSCTCVANGTPWCEHIEQTIKSGSDAPAKVADFPQLALVPVVPTHDFFVNVRVEETVEDGFRMSYVESALYDKLRTKADLPMKMDRFLGYFGPGEGRMVLRSLVIEWLRPHYRTAPPCKSVVHRSQRWSKADKRESPLAITDWSSVFTLLVNERCQSCLGYGEVTGFQEDAPVLSVLGNLLCTKLYYCDQQEGHSGPCDPF